MDIASVDDDGSEKADGKDNHMKTIEGKSGHLYFDGYNEDFEVLELHKVPFTLLPLLQLLLQP